MPVLACIGLSLVIYFLLMGNIKDMKITDVKQIQCGKCSKTVDVDYTFCPDCNEKLKEPCNHCHNMIDINWRYCPYCGNTKEYR